MGAPEIEKLVGGIVALILLVAASIAILRWGIHYKTASAKVGAVLMIVGLWLGIARPGAFLIFVAGLVVMLVVRKQFVSRVRS
jgi:hypothetical protein